MPPIIDLEGVANLLGCWPSQTLAQPTQTWLCAKLQLAMCQVGFGGEGCHRGFRGCPVCFTKKWANLGGSLTKLEIPYVSAQISSDRVSWIDPRRQSPQFRKQEINQQGLKRIDSCIPWVGRMMVMRRLRTWSGGGGEGG